MSFFCSIEEYQPFQVETTVQRIEHSDEANNFESQKPKGNSSNLPFSHLSLQSKNEEIKLRLEESQDTGILLFKIPRSIIFLLTSREKKRMEILASSSCYWKQFKDFSDGKKR